MVSDLHGNWDIDEDEVPATEHNPKCTCDDCDPLDMSADSDMDIDSPNYHAPNRCHDPKCDYPQCQDGGAHSEEYEGERIWWKTVPNLDAVLEEMKENRKTNVVEPTLTGHTEV